MSARSRSRSRAAVAGSDRRAVRLRRPGRDACSRISSSAFRPYQTFCRRRGITPSILARWEDVPAVPTRVFRASSSHAARRKPSSARAARRAARRRAGATRSPPGPLPRVRAGGIRAFRAARRRPPPLSLPAAAAGAPSRVLARPHVRVGGRDARPARRVARRRRRGSTSRASRRPSPSSSRRARPSCSRARRRASSACSTPAPRSAFRSGSRLMDTGGQKGLDRPLSRAGFLRACWTHLGFPPTTA